MDDCETKKIHWKSCVWCISEGDDEEKGRRKGVKSCFSTDFDSSPTCVLPTYARLQQGTIIGRSGRVGELYGLQGDVVSGHQLNNAKGFYKFRVPDNLYYPWRLRSLEKIDGAKEVLILSPLDDYNGAFELGIGPYSKQGGGLKELFECYKHAKFNVRVRKVESEFEFMTAFEYYDDYSLDHVWIQGHGNFDSIDFGNWRLGWKSADPNDPITKTPLRMMRQKLKISGAHIVLASCSTNSSKRGIEANDEEERLLETVGLPTRACPIVELRYHPDIRVAPYHGAAAGDAFGRDGSQTDVHDLASLVRKLLPHVVVEANENLSSAEQVFSWHVDPAKECMPGRLGRISYKTHFRKKDEDGKLNPKVVSAVAGRSLPRCKLYDEGLAENVGVCLGSCRNAEAYDDSCSGLDKEGNAIPNFGGQGDGRRDLVPTQYTLMRGGSCKDTRLANGQILSPHVRTVCIVPPRAEKNLASEERQRWERMRALEPMDQEGAEMRDEVLKSLECPRIMLPTTLPTYT
jgi:hypothetical protein